MSRDEGGASDAVARTLQVLTQAAVVVARDPGQATRVVGSPRGVAVARVLLELEEPVGERAWLASRWVMEPPALAVWWEMGFGVGLRCGPRVGAVGGGRSGTQGTVMALARAVQQWRRTVEDARFREVVQGRWCDWRDPVMAAHLGAVRVFAASRVVGDVKVPGVDDEDRAVVDGVLLGVTARQIARLNAG